MSSLEQDFRALMFETSHARDLANDERVSIARWFAKTAAVINSSQNYRVLIPSAIRHAVATGIPEEMAVFVGRCAPRRGKLGFAQGAAPILFVPSEQARSAALHEELARVFACAIRIEDLVATVVLSLTRRLRTPDLAILWPISDEPVRLDSLPHIGDFDEALFVTNAVE